MNFTSANTIHQRSHSLLHHQVSHLLTPNHHYDEVSPSLTHSLTSIIDNHPHPVQVCGEHDGGLERAWAHGADAAVMRHPFHHEGRFSGEAYRGGGGGL